MALIDIFNNDAFHHTVLNDTLENSEHVPSRLGQIGIFTKRPIRGTSVAFEVKDNKSLGLIQTTPRGAPVEQVSHGKRRLRSFETVRVGLGDRINASEIQFVRQMGEEQAVKTLQAEIAQRWDGLEGIRPRIELTLENMRLNAIMGKMVDADGSVIEDWVKAFDKQGATATTVRLETFDFATLKDGALREKLNKLGRKIARESDGVWTPQSKFHSLVGDDFFDALGKNEEVRQYYTRNGLADKVVDGNEAFSTISIYGWTFENYRGTDDQTTVSIETDEGHCFPTNTRGAFQQILSPAEGFDDLGTMGRDMYSYLEPDKSVKASYVDLEMMTYPLFVCARPKMLTKFKLA